ncbi:unnamed protein product, partial [Didymodactylos carnosus]
MGFFWDLRIRPKREPLETLRGAGIRVLISITVYAFGYTITTPTSICYLSIFLKSINIAIMQPYPHPARRILSILQLIYEEIINVLNNLTVLIKKLAEIEQIRLTPIISITNECLEMLEKSRKTLSSIKTFPRFRNLFSKDKFQKKMRNVYADAIATPNNFVYLTGLTPTTFEEVYRQ